MAETRRRGLAAAPGLAAGPLALLPEPGAAAGAVRGPLPLGAALAAARLDLEALAAEAADDAAEILAFQVEMLADPALAEGARAAIDAGAPPAAAWTACMDAYIRGYGAAEDPYMAARAADLADIKARVLAALTGEGDAPLRLPPGAVVAAHDLTPSRFLAVAARSPAGIALAHGHPTSHVAILARARGIPLVTNLGERPEGGNALLDGAAGLLVLDPDPATVAAFARNAADETAKAARAAKLAGTLAWRGRPVVLTVNVDDPAAVADAVLKTADGVGLLRSEFLFMGRDALPGEDEQAQAYADLLNRLNGKPLVVRTLDVGGDKPLPGLTLPAETNPFLGLRGIRLSLAYPETLRPQLRALLRAAAGGDLRVMLPMVSVPDEVEAVRALMAEALADLEARGIPARPPPLGIMVETPAAALALDRFDIAFASIGSNDLVQYTLAASRDAPGPVARLADPYHPAVTRLIEATVAAGRAKGIDVSLCGDLASDPKGALHLLRLGIRRLSVAPAALDRVRLAVHDDREETA
ncbi:MAG: phosphoenolpyruvate--protein phosphotransferase [Geminicoccaceae bacterium]|nr:phosphoenolpyruvate--protein phosphotransferase [Geminicoccaceae bacterium]